MNFKQLGAWALAGAIGFTTGCAADTDSLSTGEQALADSALAALPAVSRVEYAKDGIPHFIAGYLAAAQRVNDVAEAELLLRAPLQAIAPAFGLRADELVANRVMQDELGMTHIRYQQVKDGLPVVGGEMILHIAEGAIRSVTSTARDDRAIDPTPSLAAATAQQHALDITQATDKLAGEPELTYLVSSLDETLHLAWKVEVVGQGDTMAVRDHVYVDAHSGEVVGRYAQHHSVRNRRVYDQANRLMDPGADPTTGATLVLQENSTPIADAVAMAAFNNTGDTYDCLSTLFQRDSYDNRGSALISVVHGRLGPNPLDNVNAYWNGFHMVYGDGDGGNLARPLAYSRDVTTHELVHGMTEYTAGLVYQNEPGGLNEGMSDIFAAVCEAWKDGAVSANTWLVGEEVWTPATPGDALRYMHDPALDARNGLSSTDYYPERITDPNFDYGGVHFNSGLANLSFKLLVTGGVHPRNKTNIQVAGVGMEKAGKIFYRALSTYFTANTQFAGARAGTEQAARDLYGPQEAIAVGLAWAAVGVGVAPEINAVPPTVSITSPAQGAEVSGAFSIEVAASDDEGVAWVEVQIDGRSLGVSETAPYVFQTEALLEGSHTITAIASDLFNESTATATITVGKTVTDPDNPGDPGTPGGNGGGSGATPSDLVGGCNAGNGQTGGLAGLCLFMAGLFLVRRRRS